jgi:hypothetical protein
MPPPLPKTATPPALPDPAQANKVTGEIRVVGTGGRAVMGIEYRVQVHLLDGNVIGEGNLTDGLHIQFTTTVGNHVFALTEQAADGRPGRAGRASGRCWSGCHGWPARTKAWEMKESLSGRIQAAGPLSRWCSRPPPAFGQPAISKNIKVNKK